MASSPVYLELGTTTVFAVSLDWPGWCRRAKTADLALEALDAYRARYAEVVTVPFAPGSLEVIGTLEGTTTTDFGAPSAIGPWDHARAATSETVDRLCRLRDCWNFLDAVVEVAPLELRRGSRGGGRNRDGIVDHVREAERVYSSKAGSRVAPRTPWDEQRDIIVTTLQAADEDAAWPAAYALRRVAWHVVDHAWEIQDRSDSSLTP